MHNDYSLQAEYKDGYIFDEDSDKTVYILPNTYFSTVVSKKLEEQHGPMVRWSMFKDNKRIDIDWTKVPKNARPIRMKQFETKIGTINNNTQSIAKAVFFGYDYIDHSRNKIISKLDRV